MHEPATALTDFLLTLECAAFAVAVARRSTADFLRRAFIALFGSVAVAAFAGGTVHGFFPDPEGAASRALWLLTLLSIGVTAVAMAAVAARVALPRRFVAPAVAALTAGGLVYAGVLLFVSRDFVVAIAAYLPASLLLMAALVRQWARWRTDGALAGVAGVVLALVGAAGQQAGIGLHPVHFDHNAVYHIVQMVALYLLFRCAVGLIDDRSDVAAQAELARIR